MADNQSLAQALKNFISPTSVAGQTGLQDAYRQYALEAQTNGQQPMPFNVFIQQQQAQQQPRS